MQFSVYHHFALKVLSLSHNPINGISVILSNGQRTQLMNSLVRNGIVSLITVLKINSIFYFVPLQMYSNHESGK